MKKLLFAIIFLFCFISVGFLVKPAHAAPFMSSGLVGYWKFDGSDMATNTIIDASGNGNTATLGNATATTRVAGKIGQALKFDGVDDYVNIPYSVSLEPANFTISLWAKYDSTSTEEHMITHDHNTSLFAYWIDIERTAGQLHFNSRTTSDAPYIGKWTHIVGTFDGTKSYLYVNGVLINSGNESISYSGTYPVTIGSYGTNQYLFKGLIDDVRVYNRALSATEVKQLYNYGRAIIKPQ